MRGNDELSVVGCQLSVIKKIRLSLSICNLKMIDLQMIEISKNRKLITDNK